MPRKLRKDTLDFAKGNVILPVTSSVVTGLGGSAAGLTAISNQMPTVGAAIGGGAVIRVVGNIIPKQRKTRRRR